MTLDPAGCAHAVPAAADGTTDAVFTRWSPTGVLLHVGTLSGDGLQTGAGLLPASDGGWFVFTSSAQATTYDPAGPRETQAACHGEFTTFTLRLRTP